MVCTVTALALALAPAFVAHAPAAAARGTKCSTPPVTMRLEAGGTTPVGGTSVRVTDGVARRVAILPEARVDFDDASGRAELEKRAAKTPLALYTVYLADFDIPRRELRGFSFGDIAPTATGTIAALTMVPPVKKGLTEGDVAMDRDLAYESTTTFAPLGLTVRSARNASAALAYTDVVGQAKILQLTPKRICVDVDLEVRNGDQLVTALEGVVAVPIVRAASSFFYT
jgi:hypothetical protein